MIVSMKPMTNLMMDSSINTLNSMVKEIKEIIKNNQDNQNNQLNRPRIIDRIYILIF